MDKEILYRYFNGTTSPEEDRRVMDWAESSPENYKEYLEERKIWCALLLHSTPRQARRGAGPVRKLFVRIAAAAAVVTVLAGVTALFYAGPGLLDSRMQAIVVPPGQRVEMTLPDGTKVWLNSRSRLEYPVSFGWRSRRVNFSGEGYFEVEQDKRKPFVVQTGDFDVRVLGTTFNVYAYGADREDFEVSLLEGSVEVTPLYDTSLQMVLRPNETAAVAPDGRLIRRPLTDMDRFLWREGIISLNDVTFSELIERFSDYFDTEILLTTDKYNDVRCTGKFRQIDGIDYSLRVLQNFVNFQYAHDSLTQRVEIR